VPLSADRVAEQPPARTESRRFIANTAGLKVLAVDNEQAIVAGLEALLGQWGIITRKATSRAVAISFAEIEVSDLIIADFHIGPDDGLDLIADIRERWGVRAPAILITADPSPELRARAAGADVHYLRKPVKPAALRAIISQMSVQRKAAE
jgi:CheY-like chemotaxis protein